MEKQDIIIYKQDDGKISVDILIENETFWMTNLQISKLFGKSKGTISEHIKNIYEEGEFKKNELFGKTKQFKLSEREKLKES